MEKKSAMKKFNLSAVQRVFFPEVEHWTQDQDHGVGVTDGAESFMAPNVVPIFDAKITSISRFDCYI